ncbi:MAG: hypothetical protein CVU60_15780 [Deltaproteobacteria bacterium HGW-Deltaproteobacteria-18]|nr:MAG: hypothetical protein CVU60_15780 [Deltaproteobacteria bacterium HGW-Deltaproteobacteria-18]
MQACIEKYSTSCPICGTTEHKKLYPAYSGRCITSQLFFCNNITLDNRCCAGCGFIFNARGVRGIEESVYNSEVWKPKPQIMSFTAASSKMTSHQRAFSIFNRLVKLPTQGHVLDFGAGTGAFLECFQIAYPDWRITAIEPGGGFSALTEKIRLEAAHNLPYYNAPVNELFDAVIVTSVLEHTPDPLSALRWIHARLKPGGKLLTQHPNFEFLPGDLFCADHINKLTIPSMLALCRHAGFVLDAEDSSTLMYYATFRNTATTPPSLKSCFEENMPIARQCEHIAQRTIASVETAVRQAQIKGGKAAVFGTSPIGSMAHLMLSCKDDIACFVDENPYVWGHEVDDIPIVGPNKMADFGVTDIALAISPLYWDIVHKKMSIFSATIHTPSI